MVKLVLKKPLGVNKKINDSKRFKILYLQFQIKQKRTNPMEYLDFELPIRTRRSVRKCIVIGKNQMLMLQILVSKSTRS
jgi:hypothetical protein